MATESILTVLYDGNELVEVDKAGKIVIGRLGASRARIDPSRLDVQSKLAPWIESLQQQVAAGSVNPYKEALRQPKPVWDAIPRSSRGGMRLKDVGTVLDAVLRVANGSVQ